MEIKNKKAYYDYEIKKEIEAGIVLQGTEIKSLRQGSGDLKDSFAIIKNKEIFLLNMYIAKYESGNIYNHDERKTRKLLLHKKEITKLKEQLDTEGMSLVPLKMYLKNGKVKVLIGLAKGKKTFDKRRTLKEKEMNKEKQKITY